MCISVKWLTNRFRLQVFIDDLDAIAPVKKEGIDELSLKMVTTLLILMDGINRTEGVLVIAATSRPDKIEPALRRPGRLDRETETGNMKCLCGAEFSFNGGIQSLSKVSLLEILYCPLDMIFFQDTVLSTCCHPTLELTFTRENLQIYFYFINAFFFH